MFEMSLEDYDRDKFDIIGNTIFQQQWIPEFVVSEPATQEVIEIDESGKVHEGEKIGKMVKAGREKALETRTCGIQV